MIKQAIIRLKWQESAEFANRPPAPHLLRGAIAGAFPNNTLFHQHDENGKLLYRYPLIQYRWDTPKKEDKGKKLGDGLIVGFGEAVDSLTQLFTSDLNIKLGDTEMQTPEISCELRKCDLRIDTKLNEYFFRSPWIPLKQEKYEEFIKLSRNEQKTELNRIMVSNILMVARGLDIKFEETVYAIFQEKHRQICQYKDMKFQGFTGRLITNVNLPEDIAIGKKVAHGFGWIKTINNK